MAALADWCVIGLHAGLRKSEWAQPGYSQCDPEDPELNPRGDPQAFCINDIEIETLDRKRHKGLRCLLVGPNDVRKMWITFRMQKNKNHGERRMFTRAMLDGAHCFIQAMFRIMLRFQRLWGKDAASTPLAMYKDEDGRVVMVTPGVVEKHMRTIASKVCGITKKEDLARWSCHSLRVGACVLLHALGYTETQLQWLLRWKSDAFTAYLRNLAGLADKHALALDEAAAMPHFF